MIFTKIAADLDSNPKVRKAGAGGREVFLFALRKNAAHDFNGCVPKRYFETWYLADQLMVDEVTAGHGLSRSVTAGLLTETDDGFLISGWDDEWAKRPLTDAERKRRSRQKTNPPADMPVDVTNGHDTSRTESDSHACHGSEKSREEEIRVEEKRGEVPPSAAKRRKQPAISLPSDWTPTAEHRELAAKRDVDLEIQAAKFRAHAEANDRHCVRWNAAFTQWLLGSYAERRSSQQSSSSGRVEPKGSEAFVDGEVTL